MSASKSWRSGWFALQAVLGLLLIAFIWRSVAENWNQFEALEFDLNFRAVPLAAAIGTVWLTYAVLIESWRRLIVGSTTETFSFMSAAAVWTVSNLGRYLPGKVWSVAGLAVLAGRAGVPPVAATGAALAMQVLVLLTGGTFALFAIDGNVPRPWLLPVLAGAALLGLAGFRLVLRYVPSRWTANLTRPKTASVAGAAVAVAASWLTYGVAFWLLAKGILPENPLTVGTASTIFASSYILGLVAVFAPGGIGVREGIMVSLLVAPLGAGGALVLAVASRLMFTFTEIVAAAVFLPRTDIWKSGVPSVE